MIAAHVFAAALNAGFFVWHAAYNLPASIAGATHYGPGYYAAAAAWSLLLVVFSVQIAVEAVERRALLVLAAQASQAAAAVACFHDVLQRRMMDGVAVDGGYAQAYVAMRYRAAAAKFALEKAAN